MGMVAMEATITTGIKTSLLPLPLQLLQVSEPITISLVAFLTILLRRRGRCSSNCNSHSRMVVVQAFSAQQTQHYGGPQEAEYRADQTLLGGRGRGFTFNIGKIYIRFRKCHTTTISKSTFFLRFFFTTALDLSSKLSTSFHRRIQQLSVCNCLRRSTYLSWSSISTR